jgi:hypothetical protein
LPFRDSLVTKPGQCHRRPPVLPGGRLCSVRTGTAAGVLDRDPFGGREGVCGGLCVQPADAGRPAPAPDPTATGSRSAAGVNGHWDAQVGGQRFWPSAGTQLTAHPELGTAAVSRFWSSVRQPPRHRRDRLVPHPVSVPAQSPFVPWSLRRTEANTSATNSVTPEVCCWRGGASRTLVSAR